LAINAVILGALIQAAKAAGNPCRMVCLGYPDMLVTEQQLGTLCGPGVLERVAFREDSEAILAWHGLKGSMPRMVESRSLFSALGIESEFVDIVSSRGLEIVTDLNQPVPEALLRRFDIVYDGGTMEHVFNVGQVMRNVIAMAKTGGYIIHVNPLNLYNHGFFSFSPTFYHDFYTQSGNRIVSDFICLHGPVLESRMAKLPATQRFGTLPEKSVLLVMAQKMSDREPSWPMQDKYFRNSELKA
jgi:hypothetical protein